MDVAVVAQAVLHQVRDEVAHIQRGIAFAEQVQVQPVQLLAVDQHLVGIAVTVDAGGRVGQQVCAQSLGGWNEGLDAHGPLGAQRGDLTQALMQHLQLIIQCPAFRDQGADSGRLNRCAMGGRAGRRRLRGGGCRVAMRQERGFRRLKQVGARMVQRGQGSTNARGQLCAAAGAQQPRGHHAGNLALQPQLLLGQDGQCLGDGQPGQAEAACMQRLLHPEAVTVGTFEAQLAQQDLLLGIGAR